MYICYNIDEEKHMEVVKGRGYVYSIHGEPVGQDHGIQNVGQGDVGAADDHFQQAGDLHVRRIAEDEQGRAQHHRAENAHPAHGEFRCHTAEDQAQDHGQQAAVADPAQKRGGAPAQVRFPGGGHQLPGAAHRGVYKAEYEGINNQDPAFEAKIAF